jgi:hypothetical protein
MYRMKAEAPGFFIAVYNDVELRAGAKVRLDFNLQNGAPQEMSVVAIGGIVHDETGAPITGARVSVRGARFQSEETRTDFEGAYHIPSVSPGTYSVHVEGRGFRPETRDNISFGVPSNLEVNFTLVSQTQSPEAVSVKFQRRLAETHDVLPLISELFIPDFDDYIAEQFAAPEEALARTGQLGDMRSGRGLYRLFRIDPQLAPKLQRGDRQRYVAQSVNFAYLSLLGLIKSLPPNALTEDSPGLSELPPFEQLFPDVVPLFRENPTLAAWLKQNDEETVTVSTLEQFRSALSVVERVVALMRARVSNPTVEQSRMLGILIAGFETYMYNEGVRPRETVCRSCGRFPEGTRLFQVMLTLPGLVVHVVEVNGQMRIAGIEGFGVYDMMREVR